MKKVFTVLGAWNHRGIQHRHGDQVAISTESGTKGAIYISEKRLAELVESGVLEEVEGEVPQVPSKDRGRKLQPPEVSVK